jgi:hypothetical protein
MAGELPSFEGFLKFVRDYMGVPVSAAADDGYALQCAFEAASEWMPKGTGLEMLPALYKTCVYNLAASFLLNFANDIPPGTYFADARSKLGLGKKVTGVMTAAADQGTSGSTVIGDALSNLSLADLMLLQDPYGKVALAILMELGPYWGLTR